MSRIAMAIAVIVLFAWYAAFAAAAWKQGKRGKFRWLSDPFRNALERRDLFGKLQPWLARPRLALAILNGGTCDRDRLLGWAAEVFGLVFAVAASSGLLAFLAERPALFAFGLFVACGLPALKAKDLTSKANARKMRIALELPELIGKLVLLVGAGENMHRALARCAERKPAGSGEHPLYDELRSAIEAMRSGESMAHALEEMGRRCAVPEAKWFCATLLIHAKVGGDTLVPALSELSRRMWETRKAIVRTFGEQASSRLAFPLAVVFLLIMVLVGAPTILMM